MHLRPYLWYLVLVWTVTDWDDSIHDLRMRVLWPRSAARVSFSVSLLLCLLLCRNRSIAKASSPSLAHNTRLQHCNDLPTGTRLKQPTHYRPFERRLSPCPQNRRIIEALSIQIIKQKKREIAHVAKKSISEMTLTSGRVIISPADITSTLS